MMTPGWFISIAHCLGWIFGGMRYIFDSSCFFDCQSFRELGVLFCPLKNHLEKSSSNLDPPW